MSIDNNSPGYVESVFSSKRKSKEDLQVNQLIPDGILASIDTKNNVGIEKLLESYYDFMNMNEFIYQDTETFSDRILDSQAVFRYPDPDGTGNEFFADHDGANSTLKIGTTTITLTSNNVQISNGNDLPGSLAKLTTEHGKTFTVTGLGSYNGQTATLTTPIKHWVGPGPSYVLNALEDAMDIDKNLDDNADPTSEYLRFMQKEIAAIIPRNITVNKATLYKRIIDFYRIRGSQDSIATFFRLFFEDDVEVTRPWDDTLIPSSGNWDSDAEQFVSRKGFISEKKIRLQDSYRYQKYSYLIKTGRNFEDWESTFNRLVHPAGFIFFGEILILLQLTRQIFGDSTKGVTVQTKNPETGLLENQLVNVYGGERINRFTLSSMPGIQPGLIGAEDLPLLIEAFASMFTPTAEAKINRNAVLSAQLDGSGTITSVQVVSPGFGFSSPPSITITPTVADPASLVPVLNSLGEIESVTIVDGGSGYTSASLAVGANSGVGTVTSISFPTESVSLRQYRRPPIIRIDAPTAKDADGNLASTNVQATAQFNLEATGVERVKIISGGSGYTSRPTVTFSAPSSGTTAEGFASINELGEVDGVYMTVQGSGYTQPPVITISGGSGSGASAESLMLPANITNISITNAGNGYVVDPKITLGSTAVTELRAKDIKMILIILLNDLTGVSDNNYFNRKGNRFNESDYLFNSNLTIEQLGSQIIQTDYKNTINRYNTSSFINLD